MTNNQAKSILAAVERHPNAMSALLLEHLLRGEPFGRMEEKGLLDSTFFGALLEVPGEAIARFIEECLHAGWITRTTGFYPALTLTRLGATQLASWTAAASSDLSEEHHYRAYYRWRQTLARSMRKPSYRILTNAALNELAARRPTSLEELLAVPGLGKRRALRYQEGLINVGRDLRAPQSVGV